jgi:glyoxylase-like metal-dependent hydrolase (beta-lactamase superfamily II)
MFRVPVELDKWTATNVVVIVNDADVTVFDSNTRPSTARRIIAEIRRITPRPVRTLINSHWHMDHWSGNDEYVKAWPGLQIVATVETRDYMKRMGSHFFAHGLETGMLRERASLDSAIRTGKRSDGTALTAEGRRAIEADLEDTRKFAAEVAAIPRVLPTIAFRDSLVLWSGTREFQLVSLTGDATGSTVLFLPREKLLVTGDVLVARANGMGPPPWTTNSFAITPWYHSLRRMQAMGASVIVPGQGHAFRDGNYLATTADLFGAVLDQAHAALEGGAVTTAQVQAKVNVDAIGRRYPLGPAGLDGDFRAWVNTLVRKVVLESYDGVAR